MGFKRFWFLMCDICHGFLEGWMNTLLSKYLDIRVLYASGPLLQHDNMSAVIQMKQTWDLNRCNKNNLVLSQKQREVIYPITKDYKRVILLQFALWLEVPPIFVPPSNRMLMVLMQVCVGDFFIYKCCQSSICK